MGVCLSASNEIGVLLEGPVVLNVVTALWDNGLYDPLFDCWTTLDLRRDEGVEVMTLVGVVFVSHLGCPDFHLVYALC